MFINLNLVHLFCKCAAPTLSEYIHKSCHIPKVWARLTGWPTWLNIWSHHSAHSMSFVVPPKTHQQSTLETPIFKNCNTIHPWKLTWHWKNPIFNRKYIFKWWIFHCHASLFFWEGTPQGWPWAIKEWSEMGPPLGWSLPTGRQSHGIFGHGTKNPITPLKTPTWQILCDFCLSVFANPYQVLQSDLVWIHSRDLFKAEKWPSFGESKGHFEEAGRCFLILFEETRGPTTKLDLTPSLGHRTR